MDIIYLLEHYWYTYIYAKWSYNCINPNFIYITNRFVAPVYKCHSFTVLMQYCEGIKLQSACVALYNLHAIADGHLIMLNWSLRTNTIVCKSARTLTLTSHYISLTLSSWALCTYYIDCTGKRENALRNTYIYAQYFQVKLYLSCARLLKSARTPSGPYCLQLST